MKNFLVVKKLPPSIATKPSLINILPTELATLVDDAWTFEKRRLAVVKVKASFAPKFVDRSFKIKGGDQVSKNAKSHT